MTVGEGGSKFGESEDAIPTNPLPSPISCSHSYTIVPPSAARSEIGFDAPLIEGGLSPLHIGLGPTYEIIFGLDMEFTLSVIISSLKQPVRLVAPVKTLTLTTVLSTKVTLALDVSNVLVGDA